MFCNYFFLSNTQVRRLFVFKETILENFETEIKILSLTLALKCSPKNPFHWTAQKTNSPPF